MLIIPILQLGGNVEIVGRYSELISKDNIKQELALLHCIDCDMKLNHGNGWYGDIVDDNNAVVKG